MSLIETKALLVAYLCKVYELFAFVKLLRKLSG